MQKMHPPAGPPLHILARRCRVPSGKVGIQTAQQRPGWLGEIFLSLSRRTSRRITPTSCIPQVLSEKGRPTGARLPHQSLRFSLVGSPMGANCWCFRGVMTSLYGWHGRHGRLP